MTFDIKKFLLLAENRIRPTGVKQYTVDDSKITATIDAKLGKKYEKLVDDLKMVDDLKEQIKSLQTFTKSTIRSDIAFLFEAEDAVFTRVIETKNVILEISKDPKETESPQYKKILEALEKHLTPDLVEVLESLKKEHVTKTQKDPAIRYKFKEDATEDLDLDSFQKWLTTYDKKLDLVKSYL